MNSFFLGMVIVIFIIELVCIIVLSKKIEGKNKAIKHAYKAVSKNERLFLMALKWAEKNRKFNCVYEYLKNEGYSSIIIYGMHYAGNMIVEELKDTDINIVCGLDRNCESVISFIKTIHPDKEIPKADVIVVTPIASFPEIEDMLRNRVNYPIISLEDIIYD